MAIFNDFTIASRTLLVWYLRLHRNVQVNLDKMNVNLCPSWIFVIFFKMSHLSFCHSKLNVKVLSIRLTDFNIYKESQKLKSINNNEKKTKNRRKDNGVTASNYYLYDSSICTSTNTGVMRNVYALHSLINYYVRVCVCG